MWLQGAINTISRSDIFGVGCNDVCGPLRKPITAISSQTALCEDKEKVATANRLSLYNVSLCSWLCSCILVHCRYITPEKKGFCKSCRARSLHTVHRLNTVYVDKCVLVTLVQMQWQISGKEPSCMIYDRQHTDTFVSFHLTLIVHTHVIL